MAHRTNRNVGLLEAGGRLYADVARCLADICAALTATHHLGPKPRGPCASMIPRSPNALCRVCSWRRLVHAPDAHRRRSNYRRPTLLTAAGKLQRDGYCRREETIAAILALWKEGVPIQQSSAARASRKMDASSLSSVRSAWTIARLMTTSRDPWSPHCPMAANETKPPSGRLSYPRGLRVGSQARSIVQARQMPYTQPREDRPSPGAADRRAMMPIVSAHAPDPTLLAVCHAGSRAESCAYPRSA